MDAENRMTSLAEVLTFLIEKGPGRTESELADAIYGDGSYQQLVNGELRFMLNGGRIERRGDGGSGSPYRYWPAG